MCSGLVLTDDQITAFASVKTLSVVRKYQFYGNFQYVPCHNNCVSSNSQHAVNDIINRNILNY